MTKLPAKELYAMFLRSQWWIDLSFTKRCHVRKCEKCGCTYGLQCHHIRYPENWFDTKLSDLQVLCRDCHEQEHHISKVVFTPNTKKQAKQWRQGASKRAWKGHRNFKKSRKKRVSDRSKRERLQGLGKVQWKPWQKFRTTPIHHYVNRGKSSN